MTLEELIAYLESPLFKAPDEEKTKSMVYQGHGFSGTCQITGEEKDKWIYTHCWSTVAEKGADILVWAKCGTKVPEELFNRYIELLKDLSPNIRKNIEDHPPTYNPLRARFVDHTGKSGYPQYYYYVLWKQIFQNPKAIPLYIYLRDTLDYEPHEAFIILMTSAKLWYKDVYGGRIIERFYPNRHATYSLLHIDKVPHKGNYQLGTHVNKKMEYKYGDRTQSPLQSVADLTREIINKAFTGYYFKQKGKG